MNNIRKTFQLRSIFLFFAITILTLVIVSAPVLAQPPSSSSPSSNTGSTDTAKEDRKRIIGVQYALAIRECLKLNTPIDSFEGARQLKFREIFKAAERLKGTKNFGHNIVTDDGEAHCETLVKGNSNLFGGGFASYFSLDDLDKDTLLVEVLGYKRSTLDAKRRTINLRGQGYYGEKRHVFESTIDFNQHGQIVNTDGSVFANYLQRPRGLLGPLSGELTKIFNSKGADAFKDELRKYFTNIINSNKKRYECATESGSMKGTLMVPDINDSKLCSAYSFYDCGSSTCDHTCDCMTTSLDNTPILSENEHNVYRYTNSKNNDAVFSSLMKYLTNNYFGSLSNNGRQTLHLLQTNNVLRYKFFYDFLFPSASKSDAGSGSSSSYANCKAEKIPISQVENNTNINYSDKNDMKRKIRLVNKDGKLEDYLVMWGKYDTSKGTFRQNNGGLNIRVGYHDPNRNDSQTEMSCSDIIHELDMASANLSKEDRKKIAETGNDYTYTTDITGQDASGDSGSSTPAEKTCYTNAGRSLGWILCPLLDFFKDTAQNIYQHIANNYLEISPQMFTGGGQALFAAWQIFQGIANIGFVIFLLVIIFSQLTGKGIDNYGVKRALPRLIIAAILINLSYFLCQIAVDLSNIVGKGVYDLFTSFEFNATKGVNSLATDLGTTLQSIQTGQTATSLTMFGILAGLLAGGIAVVSVGPLAALVALLISLFTAVVAILIVFVLLGLRQALAIILVATSPVAFVCYIFPGTQKLFTKWTKILSGILLTFPICGIMMGGGEFASKLLLSTEQTGFFFGLVAMLAAIAPLFFVPVVLRKSLAAVGNIGAKVSTFASGLGKKAQSGIRNNENYKNWRTRQAAGLKYDKDGKLVESRSGKFRNRIAGSSFGRAFGVQRNMSRGRAGALKELSDRTTAESLMSSDRLEAANAAQIEKATQATMDDKMALINAQTNNGAIIVGDSNAFNEYEAAKASGDTSGMRTALAKLGTENSVFGQYKRAQAKGDQDGMRSALEVAGQSKTTAKEFKRALAMDMATNADSYTAADYSAIAKQMVNGKGSQNWKMSGAEAFEWATQVNSGRINPADNSSEQLSNWATSGNNLKNVVENQIASSEQIAGLSSSNLEEINRNINAAAGAGDVKALEAQSMLKANATQTLSDYTNGTRDIGVDKLDNIAKAAGYSDFADYENQQARATLYLQQEEDFKRAISSLDPAKLRTRYGRETDANKRKIISDMYKNKTGKPI